MVSFMLNNNLKYCRQSLEITQLALGKILGVSKQTVSNWENNNDVIPLKNLVRFCNEYNYDIDYVIGLTNKNKGSQNITIDSKVIGDNLRNLRKSLNFTQCKMAKECMISQTAYSNYEQGISLITTMTLYTICKNHNISMNDILKQESLNFLVTN